MTEVLARPVLAEVIVWLGSVAHKYMVSFFIARGWFKVMAIGASYERHKKWGVSVETLTVKEELVEGASSVTLVAVSCLSS